MKNNFKILIVLLAMLPFTLTAQKNSIKFGYGTSYTGDRGFFGNSQYLEFNRTLGKRLSFSLMGGLYKADKSNNDLQITETIKSKNADAILYFHLINQSNNRFKIGGGGTYRSEQYEFLTKNPETPTLPPSFEVSDYGFSLNAEYEVFVVKNWSLGTQLSFRQYQNKDRVFFWGLNTGIRF